MLLVGVGPDGQPVGTNVDGEALADLHRAVGSVHDGGRYEITPIEVDRRLREPEAELGKSYLEVFRYRDDAATIEDSATGSPDRCPGR